MTVTKLAFDNGRSQETINQLRDALERAEAGEVVGVIGILELLGNKYCMFGSPGRSRHETSGMLLEMAMERINR